ncbi:hypothetical protein EKL29_21385 [Pantoea sp. YU22]|uniref:hypothetical protein n=1 Tax=Pantoea sp. YU22 TaxID=2497684 RepID=UPI000F87EE6B|nr:hypothetical protein [Pantoea sp. YU22]RTY53674.1 hypothetical protein EKL29_21385 [Pantoea sp. YU22]
MAAPKMKPRTNTKGSAPTVEQTATAVTPTTRAGREKSGGQPLNFNVDPEFHIELKAFATIHRKSMKQVLIDAFNEYKKNHA